MVWCGDNVGAGRMQGGRDANVRGQWCWETIVWDGMVQVGEGQKDMSAAS